MKKIRKMMFICVVLLTTFWMQISVSAATVENPLKNMPTRIVTIAGAVTGTGCDFFTPQYSSNFKMTAESSNKKVATVKVYNFDNFSGDKSYGKGYEVTRKGYGTTNIKVTVKIGKKTYTKTCKYTFYKYKNPFSSFKIGNVDYTKKLNNHSIQIPQTKLKGKISFQLKKGYKINRITCLYGNSYKNRELKNNSKLPVNVRNIFINLQDQKTKANFSINIRPAGI